MSADRPDLARPRPETRDDGADAPAPRLSAQPLNPRRLDATPYAEFHRLNATPQEFSAEELVSPYARRSTGPLSPTGWTLLALAGLAVIAAGAVAAGAF